jgi:hypothetical protein
MTKVKSSEKKANEGKTERKVRKEKLSEDNGRKG